MSGRDGAGVVAAAARRPGRATVAAASPLPPPEEVFSDWLLSLPHDTNVEEAARRQVTLIDRRGLSHPDVLCLRALLAALAGSAG